MVTPDMVEHPVEDVWYIAQWPDGTWCNWDERHGYAHMSDDYEKHLVHTYDEGYCPVRTTRVDK